MNITLVIPSRNNKKYIQFAYKSIRDNLGELIEVVLLDDASTDGTWDWMKSIESKNTKIYRNNGPERVGHTVLYDVGAEMASNEIFGIFHADMVSTPNYLKNMIKHLKPGIIVSATRIEPPLHPPGPEKIVEDFGLEPEDFKYKEFLEFVSIKENENKDKTSNGIFAPWIMFVEDFFAIGGHDKRVFRPMELEDSDLFNRFVLKGYKIVQSRDAFVFHFTSRGSRFKDGVSTHMQIPLGNGKMWNKPKDSEEYISLRQIKFREWWRKWHSNVLHDELMMPKVCKRYDVGFIVHNTGKLINILEPWCDTFYTDLSQIIINQYVINEELISQFNIKNKIKLISNNKINNILIEFDAFKFKQEHYNFIENLMFIIEESGSVGEFGFDIFKFHIKSMESYENKLIHADDPWFLEKLNFNKL